MVLSWCFSDLLTSFGDFLADDSGYVQPREGLGLGWVAGALAALAVLFPSRNAQADSYCYGIPKGQYGWVCFFLEECKYPEPPYKEYQYYHTEQGDCLYIQNSRCGYC